jgi:hypothetical protein
MRGKEEEAAKPSLNTTYSVLSLSRLDTASFRFRLSGVAYEDVRQGKAWDTTAVAAFRGRDGGRSVFQTTHESLMVFSARLH